uniref:E3 ubiquitin-protein ligase RMA n=1 Tax=Leersia perrieri TaxID=77586 RepID=A0A0D9X4P6_9ORYZ
MADEDSAVGGSGGRNPMDLNLYLGLPPLPQPPGRRLDVAADYPSLLPNSGATAAAAVEDEPRSSSASQEVVVVAQPSEAEGAAYSPSNALSAPEQVMVDPVSAWLVDPPEQQPAPFEMPSHTGRVTEILEHLSSSDIAQALGLEVIATARPIQPALFRRRPESGPMNSPEIVQVLGLGVIAQAAQPIPPPLFRGEIAQARMESGSAAAEAMPPEIRLRRLIQVSDQHQIGNGRAGLGPASRGQRANSPEADALAQSIQRSHSSLEASRKRKLNGDDGNVKGTDGVKKDDCCGCNGSFECNICLEAAKDPVVTPCGHLFCWPCIFQWLHAHSEHSDCPVCKAEVLEVNVTPIYGRGADCEHNEQDPTDNGIKIPPRPNASRADSLRQQLHMSDARGIASMVRRLIQNQDIVAGQAASSAGAESTAIPSPPPRARVRRQARQDQTALLPSAPATQQQVFNAGTGSGNQAPLPPPNANDAAPAVAVAPQQSSSVGQASISSTVGVIVEGSSQGSRRSRNSESTPTPTPTRRTRRRLQ